MLELELPAAPAFAYLLIGLVAMFDLFIPILPAGALMIAGGALAGTGRLTGVAVLAVGVLGAWLGDLGGYRLGRSLPEGKRRQLPPKAWRLLQRHTFFALVSARYLPAGRTIAAITAGRRAFRFRRFALAALGAEVLWGAGAVLMGLTGGSLLPMPVLLGVAGTVLAVGAAAALVQRFRRADGKEGEMAAAVA